MDEIAPLIALPGIMTGTAVMVTVTGSLKTVKPWELFTAALAVRIPDAIFLHAYAAGFATWKETIAVPTRASMSSGKVMDSVPVPWS